MLVFETQTIELKRRRLTFFVGLDHASPATRIARDGRQAERRVRRQQTRIHQGPNQCNRAGGITAWVAHPARLRHPGSLVEAQFREAIDPARRRAVGRGSVNDLWPRLAAGPCHIVDDCDRLDNGLVMQAQHHQIRPGHYFAFGLGVFA